MATTLIGCNAYNKENIGFNFKAFEDSLKELVEGPKQAAADSTMASIGNKIHQQAASPEKTLNESFKSEIRNKFIQRGDLSADDIKNGKTLEFKVCREIPMYNGKTKWHVEIGFKGLQESEKWLAEYRTRAMLVSPEYVEG